MHYVYSYLFLNVSSQYFDACIQTFVKSGKKQESTHMK